MSTDNFEEFDEEAKTQIRAWKAIRRDIDGADAYSKAQFNLGEIYFQHNRFEEAVKFFNNIQRMDNSELYAKIKVDLGIMAKEKGYFSEAVEEWKKVNRTDDIKAYVRAQHYISDLLIKAGDFEGALESLRNIKREDDISLYTNAQLNIGEILHLMNDYEGTIRALSNIKRSDTPRSFALAQTNIGNIFHMQGKVQEAIEFWSNILPTDDAELHANAQYNIGHEAYENGNIDEALSLWRAIKRTDNPKIYAITNFNIGATLREIGDNEGAILAWRNVQCSDDSDSFAKAKFSIGIILSEKGKNDEALIAWNEINREDSPEIYAKAQYNIGCNLKDNGDSKGALSAWEKVKRTDDPETFGKAIIKSGFLLELEEGRDEAIEKWSEVKRIDSSEAYAIAQSNIGDLLIDSNPNLAKKAWLNITQSDDPKIYAYTQFKLGNIYIEKQDNKNAKKYFKSSEVFYPFESYCYIKIIRLLEDSTTQELGQCLLSLLKEVLNIVDILKLDFNKYDDEEKPFERKLAHYTSTDTANFLIAENDKKTLPSPFRLNTINNVNDPSEGQLLINKLKGINNKSFKLSEFNEEFHAFISCFTFNHDSLNQFRLYGKQDNKEASGISLVFKKDFFQPKNSIGGLSFLAMSSSSNVTLTPVTLDKKIQHNLTAKTKDVHNKIEKQPIMRCVYLDPTSDYFHLAQRNRLTFFREFGEATIVKDGQQLSKAEYEWDLYKQYIDKVTKEFSKAFSDLKTIYENIEAKVNAMTNTVESNDKEALMLFIDQILLPLKYLIKHSAFREEEECRMIYVTSIDSPEVTMHYGSSLFVEYKSIVKSNLDKVYIAPEATQYHPYLVKLLSGTGVKIELSGNPYRQT